MDSTTFRLRCTALLAFAFVVSVIDLLLRRGRSTRWIEYAVLLGAVVIGIGWGAVIEAVSLDFVHASGHAVGAEQGALFGGLLGGALMMAAGRGFALDPPRLRRVIAACLRVPSWGLAVGLAAHLVALAACDSIPSLHAATGWSGDELRRIPEDACHFGNGAGALVAAVVELRALHRLRRDRTP